MPITSRFPTLHATADLSPRGLHATGRPGPSAASCRPDQGGAMASRETSGQPWVPEPDQVVHDATQHRDVKVVVGPGVYAADKVWVRPLDQSAGWLAACTDLVPLQRNRS